MLASQQFCVKWNSYSSNLQNVFPRLLTSEHFVDITLACEGQMIKCHKVVLSACSTYFEKLLVQNPCQHPIIFMKDMKHWEVQALVDFMYKGEVNVSQDELNSLLVAAEALQIRGLCGSEHANRSSHDSSRQGQSNSSVGSRIPSVSLPHDTVLSGGATVGRESPPFKRRRPPNEEKEHCPSQGAAPRVSSVMSTTNSRGEVNSLSIPHVPSVDQTRTDSFNEDVEDLPDKKPIKQELDMEDSYLEADLDADGPDEDYGSLEHQEDSDSNNREDAPPHSPLDQPGPSGLGPPSNTPVDKAATAGPGSWTDGNVVVHSLCRMEGQVHALRCCCSGCYLHLKQVMPKRGAESKSKKVMTYCSGCKGARWDRYGMSAFPPVDLMPGWGGNTLGQLNKCLEEVCRRIPPQDSVLQSAATAREGKPGNMSLWHTDSKVRRFLAVGQFSSGDSVGRYLGSGSGPSQLPADFLVGSRISRRRSAEEKALRKLEMARLRQRRFRARMKLKAEIEAGRNEGAVKVKSPHLC